MRIVIPGGSGQVGQVVARALTDQGHEVVVLGRGGEVGAGRLLRWDGRTLGEWAQAVDGADAVFNLAGRNVNCRYTPANLEQMRASRVDSTRVIGQAIAQAQRPPPVWLQMSTATIYAHRFDAPNDEPTGQIGGTEPDAPASWRNSIAIAQAWEREVEQAVTPKTRKVILRTSIVMSPDRGGIFDLMLSLVRKGLGGTVAGGAQYISWIHERDFLRAVQLLLREPTLEGVFNLAAPHPLPQRDFNRALRQAYGARIGLPATRAMVSLGAWAMRTETELALKSRRVVSSRLPEAGFAFEYPTWPEAARELAARWRAANP